MKSMLFCFVTGAALGVVLSLPFDLSLTKKQELIPLAKTLGATDFVRYVHEANLTANFTRKAGNFTLFIPVNKAWTDLSKNIAANKTLVKELILYHSVNGTFRRGELKQGTKLRTMSGRFLTFNVTKDKQSVFVNGVNITKFNQRASNGYIYFISDVLVNGSGVNNKTNSTKPSKGKEALISDIRSLGATKFAHFVHEANLTANFTRKAGNFTLFVPVNTAWGSVSTNITRNKTLVKELLLFHSVNGTYSRAELKEGKKLKTLSGKFLYFNVTKDKNVLVNGVNITKYDQWASNGNVFLLGEVILNGSGVSNKTNTTTPTKVPLPLIRRQTSLDCRLNMTCFYRGNGTHGNHSFGPRYNHTTESNHTTGTNNTAGTNHTTGTQGSITHILSKNWGVYSTLITDLMKTGVWSLLEKGHVTLLAPTNAAYQSLSDTYINNLDNDASFLEKTMKYHVLYGVHGPSTLHHNTYLTTTEGHRLHVTFHNGHLSNFNSVPVKNVIHASNGVIYVLNGVLHVPISPIV